MSNRIAVINGSPHKDGRVARLLEQLELPVIHLSDGIAPALSEVLASDIIVFATPVRWFNMSALMKELIEQMPEYPDFPLEGKTAFFIAAYEEDGAQQAINQIMSAVNHMGFHIPPYACYFYNYNMAEKSENQWQLNAMANLKKRLKSPIETAS